MASHGGGAAIDSPLYVGVLPLNKFSLCQNDDVTSIVQIHAFSLYVFDSHGLKDFLKYLHNRHQLEAIVITINNTKEMHKPSFELPSLIKIINIAMPRSMHYCVMHIT